ncbi:MAG: hypothetical protein PVI21_02335 [Candidatus Woesebacteria bacterium]
MQKKIINSNLLSGFVFVPNGGIVQKFEALTEGNLSVLSAFRFETRKEYGMPHALTLMQLAAEGYVFLAPYQIELTPKGRSLIVDGDPSIDMAARQVLQNIVNVPHDSGVTLINFDEQGRPRKGFNRVQSKDVQKILAYGWLSDNGYYYPKRKLSLAQAFSALISVIPFAVAIPVVDETNPLPVTIAMWTLSFVCMMITIRLYKRFSYKLKDRGRQVVQLLHELSIAKASSDWGDELMPWIWLTHPSDVGKWIQNRQRPEWWNGPINTWQRDLISLVGFIERSCPK